MRTITTIGAILLTLSSLGFANQMEEIELRNLFEKDQEQSFLSVENAFKLEVEFYESNSLRFYWQIAKNYYLYKNKFNAELIYEGQTYPLKIIYPKATKKTDEYFGEVEVYYGNADLRVDLLENQETGSLAAEKFSIQISSQGCADAGLCYALRQDWFEIDFSTRAVQIGEPTFSNSTKIRNKQAYSENNALETEYFSPLLVMLIFAFVGGTILNLMPCIFPILSLKIISFTQANENIKSEAWSYTAGVISSFVLFAAILIAIQSAGKAVGWGFQLQSPTFVTALAFLFLILGLAFSGSLQIGSNLMGIGDAYTKKSGMTGSFFTGALAVIVASPCSAPFMGTALGFAISQTPSIAITIFISLGAGMAAPLLLLAYSKKLREKMPQPGKWMETLKQLLAFPLYASAIWLLWIVGSVSGVNVMTIVLCGGLSLIFGFWLWSRTGFLKWLGTAFILGGIFIGIVSTQNFSESSQSTSREGTVIWSEQRLLELRSQGKPVFVDVTAKWCITCIANENTVLFTDRMSTEFEKRDITYMIADWTEYDPEIARFIEKHGRTGIPLYVFYPAGFTKAPVILPQILIFSIVIEALDKSFNGT
ncbi:MAG: protein-disulfide reductase DsbD family protein [Halieaceae bacterium]|nr:protein-disulfide reductase DsbD family protein [Halieaceae bacterium]